LRGKILHKNLKCGGILSNARDVGIVRKKNYIIGTKGLKIPEGVHGFFHCPSMFFCFSSQKFFEFPHVKTCLLNNSFAGLIPALKVIFHLGHQN
jgi:hypothetical protein